jgi:hypothetical protein
MSSQQHVEHLNQHAHQPHVHQPHSHQHDGHQHDGQQHDGHFGHMPAGLHHLKVAHRERINKLKQEGEDMEIRRAAFVHELQKHGDVHDIRHHHLKEHSGKTHPIESRMETARQHFRGMVVGIALAVLLGVYFSVNTLMAHSLPLLLAGSTIFAVGLACFILLTVFAWVRFRSGSPLAALFPAVMFGMELSEIIFAGASDCGYRMHRWLSVFHERHHHPLHRHPEVEDHLAHKHLDLPCIEHRSKEHEEPHHAVAHHAHGHTEEIHHANHYAAVHH